MTDILRRPLPRPQAAVRAGWAAELTPLLVHLRPHCQLVLSPIFLWGVLLAGGRLTPTVTLVFVAVHVFLYGGVTAYNSAYDRDSGPVSGLYRPPPVTTALLPFALLIQLVGLAAASALDLRLAVIFVAYMLLSVAYSHPHFRWKASPLRSVLVIFIGQGMLGFLAGWVATGAELLAVAAPGPVLGMLGAAGATLALFPLGHLFQLEDDHDRGDRTLALALGADRTFRFAQVMLLVSVAALGSVIVMRWGLLEALVVGIAALFAAAGLELWRRNFATQATPAIYRATMASQGLVAAGCAGFVLLKLT